MHNNLSGPAIAVCYERFHCICTNTCIRMYSVHDCMRSSLQFQKVTIIVASNRKHFLKVVE